MPTADHSTTCVRGQKTICIPCSQEQYEPIVDNPEQFRRLLDQQLQAIVRLLAVQTKSKTSLLSSTLVYQNLRKGGTSHSVPCGVYTAESNYCA